MDIAANQRTMLETELADNIGQPFSIRKIGENHYIASNCTFTTCNPKSPAWEINGSEVNYFSQNFSSSTNSTLSLNGIPVFYFPYLAWPTVKQRQSGFLPPEYMIVRSSLKKWDLGYRIGIPYFWAIDPEHDLTFVYDWVERRGPGELEQQPLPPWPRCPSPHSRSSPSRPGLRPTLQSPQALIRYVA